MFEKVLKTISESMKYSGAFCLMGMVLVTTADIIGRYFGRPVFGSEEVTAIFAVLAVAFAMPYAHSREVHVGVEIFEKWMPEKARKLLKLLVSLVSFVLFALVSWRMFLYAGSMMRSGELSMNLQLPEYLIVFVLAACFVVFTCQLALDIFKSFSSLKG